MVFGGALLIRERMTEWQKQRRGEEGKQGHRKGSKQGQEEKGDEK